MREVGIRVGSAQRKLTRKNVHDLRVALRRCRALADLMAELDEKGDWRRLERSARCLFKPLGALRDVQVQLKWTAKMASFPSGPAETLTGFLKAEKGSLKRKASRAVRKFDPEEWQRLSRLLQRRWKDHPLSRGTALQLMRERLDEARTLHQRACRGRSRESWHRLRIALKRFRYTVECLLPGVDAAMLRSLAELQDRLGRVQDLTVLSDTIRHCTGLDSASRRMMRVIVERERRIHLEGCRQRMGSKAAPWDAWSSALDLAADEESIDFAGRKA